MDLPRLKDYDISPSNGFLPDELPLERLPHKYYQPWENVVEKLPSLLLTKRIRLMIDKMPLLSTAYLTSLPEYRRAYSVLGFLTHAYIWGVDTPTNKLPLQISKPFIEVSEYLRLPPIATYSGLILWNFKKIIPDNKKEIELDNLTTINTYTGGMDESWFYLVSVYFEQKGAVALQHGLDSIKAARDQDTQKVVESLQNLALAIDELGSVLMKMEEMCDPHVFYFRIRPYLAGWKNMGDVGLKDGVFYGDESQPRVLAGGSNAQSSLLQALDLMLNVEHSATGDKSKGNAFISEMRSYMPGKHLDFLHHLSQVNCIREYVISQGSQNPELSLSYDACLAMLKSFRDKHIQIVTRYVILQAQKASKLGSQTTKTLRSGLAKSNSKKEQKGTGGTALLPFLKQCRDETGEPAAGSWGKRILSDSGTLKTSVNKKRKLDDEEDEEFDENKVVGLAGSWNDDSSNKTSGHW